MKILQFFVVIVVSLLFSTKAFTQALSYQGFECFNAANTSDSTPTNTPVASRFEVIEALGDGMFRLSLSGGLPRFSDNNQSICIDRDTAIGFVGTPDVVNAEGLPARLERIDATAYFNGENLVVTVSSIYTDLSQTRGTFSSFSTSHFQPISNTLFFDWDVDQSAFVLKKVIHNKGFVHTRGSTGSLTPFIETIVPSFGDAGTFEVPQILTPPTDILYRLE